MKVVVAEKISPSAVDLLREPRWTVVTPEQMDGTLSGQLESADALIVRSSVQVDGPLLAEARKLRGGGRQGRSGWKLWPTIRSSQRRLPKSRASAWRSWRSFMARRTTSPCTSALHRRPRA